MRIITSTKSIQKYYIEVQQHGQEIFQEINDRLEPDFIIIRINRSNGMFDTIPSDSPIYGWNLSQIQQMADLSQYDNNNETILNLYALNKLLEARFPDKVCFFSQVTVFNNDIYVCLLRFDKEDLSFIPQLQKKRNNRLIQDHNSLIAAVSIEFLKYCLSSLKELLDGQIDEYYYDKQLIFRRACEQMVNCITHQVNQSSSLFDTLNQIASLKYEGEEGIGSIILAPKDSQNIETSLLLQTPIKITESKAIRKILEISSAENFQLLCDGVDVYGFGKSKLMYNPRDENLFTINFLSHYKWELIHGRSILMTISYGQPIINNYIIERTKFIEIINFIFIEIDKDDIPKLWALVEAAMTQKKGTILVVSGEAETEATRLSAQCTRVKPVELTDVMLKRISAIDGAVLVDIKAKVHAIGVILDGMATSNGNPARGARYNSALRYSDTKKNNCLLVVVSEDKYIDLIYCNDDSRGQRPLYQR